MPRRLDVITRISRGLQEGKRQEERADRHRSSVLRRYQEEHLRAERAERRRERARQKQRNLDQLEKAKEEQLREWNAEVNAFNEYLKSIQSFHACFNPSDFIDDYEKRLVKREYIPVPHTNKELEEFIEKPFRESAFEPPLFEKSRRYEDAIKSGIWIGVGCAAIGIVLWISMNFWLFLSTVFVGICIMQMIIGNAKKTFQQVDIQEQEEEFNILKARLKREHVDKESIRLEEYKKLKAIYLKLEETQRNQHALQEEKNRIAFDLSEQKRLSVLKKAKERNSESLTLILEAALPIPIKVNPPEDYVSDDFADYEVAYGVSEKNNIILKLIVPGKSIIPETAIQMTPAGQKMKQIDLSERRRTELFDGFVGSFTLAHILRALSAFPYAASIFVETSYADIDKATGKKCYTVKCCLETELRAISAIEIDRADPMEAILGLGGECAQGRTGADTIDSILDEDNLTWASVEKDKTEIPPGIVPNEGTR